MIMFLTSATSCWPRWSVSNCIQWTCHTPVLTKGRTSETKKAKSFTENNRNVRSAVIVGDLSECQSRGSTQIHAQMQACSLFAVDSEAKYQSVQVVTSNAHMQHRALLFMGSVRLSEPGAAVQGRGSRNAIHHGCTHMLHGCRT
jgi:hypothetical protein